MFNKYDVIVCFILIDYQENYPSDYILEAISPDGDDLIATPSQENFSIDITE